MQAQQAWQWELPVGEEPRNWHNRCIQVLNLFPQGIRKLSYVAENHCVVHARLRALSGGPQFTRTIFDVYPSALRGGLFRSNLLNANLLNANLLSMGKLVRLPSKRRLSTTLLFGVSHIRPGSPFKLWALVVSKLVLSKLVVPNLVLSPNAVIESAE